MSAAVAALQQHTQLSSLSIKRRQLCPNLSKHHLTRAPAAAALLLSAAHLQPRQQKQQQLAAAQTQRRPMDVRAQADNSHAGHAVLHDFCMSLPYAALAAVSAVLAVAFKASTVGLQLGAVAAVVAACSVMSLKAWKRGGSSTPYTLVSAGASGWVGFQMWQRVSAGSAPVPSGIVLAVSAALCLFCVYNVLAGGNPPPSKKAA